MTWHIAAKASMFFAKTKKKKSNAYYLCNFIASKTYLFINLYRHKAVFREICSQFYRWGN